MLKNPPMQSSNIVLIAVFSGAPAVDEA